MYSSLAQHRSLGPVHNMIRTDLQRPIMSDVRMFGLKELLCTLDTPFRAANVKGDTDLGNSCKLPKRRHFVDADIQPHLILFLKPSIVWGTQSKKRGSGMYNGGFFP